MAWSWGVRPNADRERLMEILVTMAFAFVVFLFVAVVVAIGQSNTERRNRVRLALDQKSGEYIWMAEDGRYRSLAEERDLLQGRRE